MTTTEQPTEQTEPEGTEEEPQQPEDTTEPEQTEEEPSELAKVRAEAARHRVAAREAAEALEAMTERYRAAVVAQAGSDTLSDPSVLPWSDDWLTEDGSADLDAIRTAATEYAAAHPHAAKVRGDAGMGYRGQATGSVDLAGMLRAGA